MFELFVRWPALALLPAALFGALARWSHRGLASLAAVAWFIYAIYELLMRYRVLCSGECDIRVDLLGIYPVLAAVSVVALLAGLFGGRRPPTRECSQPRPNER